MSENNHIAAGVSFEVNGKTYRMSPLTIKDFKEMEDEFKTEALRLVKGQISGLDDDSKRYLLDKAFGDLKTVRIGSDAFNEMSQTVNGMLIMGYLTLRKNHPEITRDDVAAIFTQETINDVQGKINKMAGYNSSNESPNV